MTATAIPKARTPAKTAIALSMTLLGSLGAAADASELPIAQNQPQVERDVSRAYQLAQLGKLIDKAIATGEALIDSLNSVLSVLSDDSFEKSHEALVSHPFNRIVNLIESAEEILSEEFDFFENDRHKELLVILKKARTRANFAVNMINQMTIVPEVYTSETDLSRLSELTDISTEHTYSLLC